MSNWRIEREGERAIDRLCERVKDFPANESDPNYADVVYSSDCESAIREAYGIGVDTGKKLAKEEL